MWFWRDGLWPRVVRGLVLAAIVPATVGAVVLYYNLACHAVGLQPVPLW